MKRIEAILLFLMNIWILSIRYMETIKRDITLALNCLMMILMHRNHSTGRTSGRVQTSCLHGGKLWRCIIIRHYQISEPAKGIFGAGAHTDFGLITLLATDDVVGLQICKDKDANPQIWEYVPPLKGAFIVNLGDMLERWSNCTFRSTLHRVVCTGQERYSIAYFVEPNHDCIVECLPTCQSEKNPPIFPPIKCQDYLQRRYQDTHADLNSYQVSK
ncbi:putative 2-oxoglutarate-dependent dioxygenase [Dorcoceras hygrometricum]|uniref:Putative 2-oxoglutarate-dependent dioxygenase n=1 Tax=Dorcoceras hygrometricum TaxID=472368 RepID=A0A2Z7AVP7_9LAMI|nr:putative 2-oxoglutarate-dependent dioxygenase [Dorcoceras hygrometricum]